MGDKAKPFIGIFEERPETAIVCQGSYDEKLQMNSSVFSSSTERETQKVTRTPEGPDYEREYESD